MAFATTDQHESGMSANRANGKALRGLKAIGEYLGVSENTVVKYIKDDGLPAGKIGGGWASDVESINAWRVSRMR